MVVTFGNEMASAARRCVETARVRVEEWKIRINEAVRQHQPSPNYPDEFKHFSNAVEELRRAEQALEYLAKMMLGGS
jgi:hypothetical protein